MKQKKQKGAWKRTLASFLGLVMVVLLTVAGTLAFLHTKSNERTNVFTSTNDIKLHLDEPNYNLRETINAGGTSTYEVKDSNKLDPREYIPGMDYSKDPRLYNITGNQTKKSDGTTVEYAEEWVAMRVDYGIDVDGSGQIASGEEKSCAEMSADYTGTGNSSTPMGIIDTITFDTTNWIKVSSNKYDIYVYKYKLKATDSLKETDITNNDTTGGMLDTILGSTKASPTAATTPLFSKITIKDQATLEKNGYSIDNLKYFSIKLKGAAVKVIPTIDIDEIVNADVADTSKTSGLIVKDLIELLQ